MDTQVYGYARVSTKDQNLNRQLDALAAFPVVPANVYADQASEKDFDRPKYRKLIHRLRPGDVVVVKSIDRLGRNYAEILAQWRSITQEKHASIVVLDMPLLDTRHTEGGLTREFLAELVLQVLSYVAQVERDSIRQRQAEGIAAARARGVRFGRPRIERPEAYAALRDSFLSGAVTRRQAAEELQVSVTTFSKWLKEDSAPAAGGPCAP